MKADKQPTNANDVLSLDDIELEAKPKDPLQESDKDVAKSLSALF